MLMKIAEIKKLTDDELNKKVAIFDGWEYFPDKVISSDQWALFIDGHWAGGAEDMPDYCNNLNAMHKAIKSLGCELGPYEYWINEITGGGMCAIEATARQRAEAFMLAKTNE